MKHYKKLALTIFPYPEEKVIRTIFINALRVQKFFEAELIVLVAKEFSESVSRELENLTQKTSFYLKPKCIEIKDNEPATFLKTLTNEKPDILLVDHFLSRINQYLTIKWQIIENSRLPILVLPASRELPDTIFSKMLVPLSGETRRSSALSTSLSIAGIKDISVEVLHIERRRENLSQPSLLDDFMDEIQHEYLWEIEQEVSEAAPYASAREKSYIKKITHIEGSVSEELSKRAEDPSALLILDWGGSFALGRSSDLKQVLLKCQTLVLLMRKPRHTSTKILAGRNFPKAA